MVEQISRTATAELLHGLVSIPSPSRQEAAAVDWLCRRMDALGFATEVDGAGNAVGVRGDGSLEIMLLGHIDTVPGEVPVRVEDGNLFGRGSVDAKGPLATFVVATALAALPAGVRVRVIGSVEEEVMSSRGAHWVIDHYAAPQVVVIGEPGGWDGVVIGYKGSIAVDYRVRYPLSHSASPEPTAAELAVQFWNRLQQWCAEQNGDQPYGFASMDATLVNINSTSDGLYGSASLSTSLRLPPRVTPEEVTEVVNRLGEGAELDVRVNAPAFRSDKRSPMVAAFNAAIRAAGGTPRIKVKTGTSDMNLVGPHWNCPIVAYGPGDSRLDHSPDEHVALEDLDRGTAVLVDALERIARLMVEGRLGGRA